jgi:hypothetical protein
MFFNTASRVLKTSNACVIISIKITFTPTPICGMANDMSLGAIGISNSSTCVLTITIGIFVGSMGKNKMQEIIASLAPPFIYVGSSMVVVTGLF